MRNKLRPIRRFIRSHRQLPDANKRLNNQRRFSKNIQRSAHSTTDNKSLRPGKRRVWKHSPNPMIIKGF